VWEENFMVFLRGKLFKKAVGLIKGKEPEGKCEWCKVVGFE